MLIGGAALLCAIGLREVGGVTSMMEKVSALPWTAEHFELLPSASHEAFPWPAVVLGLGLVLGPAYWVGNQAIVQRTFGVRSQADARASYVFAACIKLVFPVLLVLPGLLALALYADELGAPAPGWDANQVLPMMIGRLVPPGALGLLIGAFIAGVMANLDSYVNSASTLLVTDLYRPFVRPHASDAECLKVGRWLVVVLLVVGAVLSYQVKMRFGSVFEAFQTFLSFFQGALFALLLFGMLTRRATAAGGVAGMLAGVGTAAAMSVAGQLYLWTAWWSFVAASVTLVVVSVMTARKSDDELRGPRVLGALMPSSPERSIVMALYGLCLFVIWYVSPRLPGRRGRPAAPVVAQRAGLGVIRRRCADRGLRAVQLTVYSRVMKPPTVFLGEMTTLEVEAFLKRHHTVIVPVGATEQHGPHAPLSTDVLHPARGGAARGADVGAVVAPSLNYALSYPHVGFTGLVHIRIPTFMALIEDLCASLSADRLQAHRVPQRPLRQHLRHRLRVRERGREAADGREGVSDQLLGRHDARTRSTEFFNLARAARQPRGDLGHAGHQSRPRRHGQGERRVPAVPRNTVNIGAGAHGVLLLAPGSVHRATSRARGATRGARRRRWASGISRSASRSTIAVLENIERTFEAMPPR